MAEKVSAIADGFEKIREWVAQVSRSKSSRSKYRGPASALSAFLDAPEIVDHLALYTRGDQRMIAGLTLPRAEDGAVVPNRSREVRQIALALGVWLYDSILRFPGVILDRVAAASFLGIDVRAFQRTSVVKPFADALYDGPFSSNLEPRWWRHRLLEILAGGDAREFVKRATRRLPEPCLCSVDDKAPAGFVCVMTRKPVCDEHSVAQVSWLPRGADLARVRHDVFDEIGPWIGMS